MRRKSLALLLLIGLPLALWVVSCNDLGRSGPRADRPRLVVLVVVDQLRPDLLERYRPLWSGGFERVLDEGFRFTDAVQDHGLTHTAAGHATLATGVHPSRSGLVGNEWWEPRPEGGRRMVYAVADSEAAIVGVPRADGRSPRNLLRGGLADWMLRSDSSTRILSLSTKDRSAIALGGKGPAHVYWFLEREARFVTSAYYRDRYPSWVEAFNRSRLPGLLDSAWTSEVPEAGKALSRPDTAEHEYDGVHTWFPHRFPDEAPGGTTPDFGGWAAHTPYPDRAVLALARTGVEELGLGADEVPDLLALGLSSTDYVGHRYGPLSREQLDNLLRLDRELGELFRFLDERVGRGRWVLALSADHGVAPTPEYAEPPGRRLSPEERDSTLRVVRRVWNRAPDPADGERSAADTLAAFSWVAEAWTGAELADRAQPADSFLTLARRSYRPDRVPGRFGRIGIMARLAEGVVWTDSRTATTHGTPYPYDRRVPLAFLGAGVEPGVSDAPAGAVDAAPTLAALAGVPFPDDLDGRALFENSPAAGGGGR